MLQTFGANPTPNDNDTFVFIPLYRKWFFDVIITSVSVDHKRLAVSCEELNGRKAIIDTGTTLIHFPSRVFNNLISIFNEMVGNHQIN